MTLCGEKVTGVCVLGKCPHFKRCHPVVWDKYGKIKPKTNEEWFCSLPTEEKAKFMCNIYEMGKNGKKYFMRLDKCMEWLKQPHTSKE